MVKLGTTATALVLWGLAATAGVAKELPDNVYACQVMTRDGIYGLVMVQADSLEKARGAASRAEAWKMGGGRGPTMSVVECVPHPGGEFRDASFQAFTEDLVL